MHCLVRRILELTDASIGTTLVPTLVQPSHELPREVQESAMYYPVLRLETKQRVTDEEQDHIRRR